MLRQRQDVLATIAQRRQFDRHHGKAIIKILAKHSLAHGLFQIDVSSRDDAHINAPRTGVAERRELALLNNAQQAHLGLGRNVANLVEKDRAAIGNFEQSFLGGNRTREGAARMTEKFRLQQLGRNVRAVYGNERAVGPRTGFVNCFGDQLFAGPAFSGNQNRGTGGRNLFN